MKITKLLWKQTASKCKNMKCSRCRNLLYGEEGFLSSVTTSHSYNQSGFRIRICWDCLQEFLKEAEEKKINKKQKFRKLVKRVILNRLK